MKTNRPQMILVAILVCLFAVGMAGLLNFFKYRSIAERIVQERLVATGQAIEHNIQALLVFLAAATLASFALLGVLNRLSRHVDTVAAALGSDDPLASSVRNGPFGTALRRYVESVRNAETEIAILRGKLAQGEKR